METNTNFKVVKNLTENQNIQNKHACRKDSQTVVNILNILRIRRINEVNNGDGGKQREKGKDKPSLDIEIRKHTFSEYSIKDKH